MTERKPELNSKVRNLSVFKEVVEVYNNVCETKTSRGGGKRGWRQKNGESTCSTTELVREVFLKCV